jgi:hypothetical protein
MPNFGRKLYKIHPKTDEVLLALCYKSALVTAASSGLNVVKGLNRTNQNVSFGRS